MKAAERIIWMSVVIIGFLLVLMIVFPPEGKAHYKPGSHNAVHAINLVWCGKSNRTCVHGNEGIRVARCEASARYWKTRPQDAVNGQYKGMLQMGAAERRKFGHGPSVWHQARAAKRYWNVSGWGPWECAHILGIV